MESMWRHVWKHVLISSIQLEIMNKKKKKYNWSHSFMVAECLWNSQNVFIHVIGSLFWIVSTWKCWSRPFELFMVRLPWTRLTCLIKTCSASRSLRSSGENLLMVPGTCFRTQSDRPLKAVAPWLWNTLPLSLRSLDSGCKHLSF